MFRWRRLFSRPVLGDSQRLFGALLASALIAAGGLTTSPAAHAAPGDAPLPSVRRTERVSVSGGGVQSFESSFPAISADGAVVAFMSSLPLAPGDTNFSPDIYVRDVVADVTQRVSVSSTGEVANGPSMLPSLSQDGRLVAFSSLASNLVDGDTNGASDVFIHDRFSGVTERVSLRYNGAQSVGAGLENMSPSISADGSVVAFSSAAPDLVLSDDNDVTDIFIHDRLAHDTRRITEDPGFGVELDGPSAFPSISGDGKFVVFTSYASNLVFEDTNAVPDVFVHRLDSAGRPRRLSEDATGANADGMSGPASISADGGFVAFVSQATNLVEGDTNGLADTFVVNRATRVVERVSLGLGGAEGDGGSWGTGGEDLGPRISADGRFVAFGSEATNLTADDLNGVPDVFVRDRVNATTVRTSTFPDEGVAGPSAFPAISGDGGRVAFSSSGSHSFGAPEIFLGNRGSDAPELVSVSAPGTEAFGASAFPSAAAEADVVAFASDAYNLVEGDTNELLDVFVHDRRITETELVSVRPDGRSGNAPSALPAITPDARFVAFASYATDLVDADAPPPDSGPQAEIYVRDRRSGTTEVVSVAIGGVTPDGWSTAPSISADGRYVAFASVASNLVAGDTNSDVDAFVVDRVTKQIRRVSVSSMGVQRNATFDPFLLPSISADGNVVVFSTSSSNLLGEDLDGNPYDTNGTVDVFAHELSTGFTQLVSNPNGFSTEANGLSLTAYPDNLFYTQPHVSKNGHYVTFSSAATNIVEGDTNRMPDVFMYDRIDNVSRLISVGGGGPGNGPSFPSTISADGRRVAFSSLASNLVTGDTNGTWDVFLKDVGTGDLQRVSVNSDLEQGNNASVGGAISPEGNAVAFVSFADNLVAGDSNGSPDVFVHEITEGVPPPPPEELFGIRPNWGFTPTGVNTATGNFTDAAVDLAFPVSGLDWLRTYNGLDASVKRLGTGWSSQADVHLEQAGGGQVRFVDADGRVVTFTPATTGGYTRPEGVGGELVGLPGGAFELRFFQGATWAFDGFGRLASQQFWDGQRVDYSFNPAGMLSTATHSVGYSLSFKYATLASGLQVIQNVTSSDGRSVAYSYDASGRLSAVTAPDGAISRYESDPMGRITKVIDASGHQLITNHYDESGRVVRQQTAHGGDFTFAYGDGSGADAATTAVRDTIANATTRYSHDQRARLQVFTDVHGASERFEYDADGNLTATVDRSGKAALQRFDAHGNLLERTEPGGVVVRYSYDASDRRVSSTDASGAILRYEYEGAERIWSRTIDAKGAQSSQDVRDGLVSVTTDPDGVRKRFTYDARRNLTAEIDGFNRATRYEHNAMGLVVKTTTPRSRPTLTDYDSVGRAVEVTDPLRKKTRYSYTPTGRLATITDARGAVTRMTYDQADRLECEYKPLGATKCYKYDHLGNTIKVTESRGVTNPGGSVRLFRYDAMGLLTGETDPVGGIHNYRYNVSGDLVESVAPTGGRYRNILDGRDRIDTGIYPMDMTENYEYDILDRRTATIGPRFVAPAASAASATAARSAGVGAVTAAAGSPEPPPAPVTRTVYDVVGNPTEEIDEVGGRTITRWSPGSRAEEITDPGGGVTRLTYDEVGQVIASTDPLGGVSRSEYDDDGFLISQSTPAGLVTRYSYDIAGRNIEIVDPRGGVTTMAYDDVGNLVSTTDSTGATQQFVYDLEGHVIEAVDPLGAVTRFTYDEGGNLIQRTDASGAVTRYAYDAADRLVSRTDPLGGTTTHTYNPSGMLASETDPSGRRTLYNYDLADRLVERIDPDGTHVRYTYDANGERATMEDPTGITSYEYDAAGRLTATTHPDGSRTTRRLDALGNPIALGYPDGTEATLRYDQAGRLVGLSHPSAGDVSYQLDAEGRLVREDLPGGWVRTYGYEGGRLMRFSETKPGKKAVATTLTRDAAGRIITEKTGGNVRNFRYDAAGQLVAVEGGSGDDDDDATTVRYSYDAAGNRVAEVTDGDKTTYRYDAAGQLLERRRDGKITRYTYDASGRLVSEVGPEIRVTRTYDASGLLVSTDHVEDDTRTVRSFTYDGAGLLGSVRTTSDDRDDDDDDDDGPGPTTETRLHWNSDGGLAQVLSMTEGGDTTNFLYGYGRAVAFGDMGAEVFSRDVFGSAVRTRGTAPWVQDERYDVFGVPLGNDDDDAGGLPRFGFRGELHLGDDIYLRARFYQPELGRFTARDPLEVQMAAPAMANPYVFARNDPVNFVDPAGLRASSGSAEPTPQCPSSAKLTAPASSGFGRGRGRQCLFKFVATNLGSIETQVYIRSASIGPLGLGYGDGRGSNAYAPWWKNRARVYVNFAYGVGNVTFSPSCIDAPGVRDDLGIPSLGIYKTCVTAEAITADFNDRKNNIKVNKNSNGTLHKVSVDAQNSVTNRIGTIDFCITYNKDWPFRAAPHVKLEHDKYPSYDNWYNLGTKTPSLLTPPGHFDETGVSALNSAAC